MIENKKFKLDEVWDKKLPKIDRNKKGQYINNRLLYTEKEYEKMRKKVLKQKLP